MKNAFAAMVSRLHDRNQVFVFPSEVAADWALSGLLEAGGAPVVPRTVCISWDRFKENVLPAPPGVRPATPVIRTLFLRALLEENAARPFFKSLVNPAHADSSLASLPALRAILPLLGRSADLVRRSAGALAAGKAADLALLAGRYAAFLKEAGLYEPDDVRSGFNPGGSRYLVFHPETIADWDRVSAAFRGHPAVEVYTGRSPGPPARPLVVHPDLETEIKRTMLAIHHLLESGTPGSRIVVTAAGLQDIAPLLEDGARAYDVKLRITEGRPLLSRPGVVFLSRAAATAASRFALRDLEAFLFDRALPWKSGFPVEALLRFGLEHNCLCNYSEHGREIDLWDDRLRNAIDSGEGRLRPALAFYRALRTQLAALTRARTPDALKKAVTKFRAVFFDANRLGEAEGRRFELALRRLDELAGESRRLPLPAVASPFAVWLSLLEDTRYVSPTVGAGIAVYPYRVSAGIAPDHHFIVNANDDLTRVIVRPYPFLAADEEARLGVAPADMSAAFLGLYLASGANVTVSCSRRSGGRVRLPPAPFVQAGLIREAGPAADDPYEEELRRFAVDPPPAAGEHLPDVRFTLQRAGLAAATSGPGKDTRPFTLAPIDSPETRERVLRALTDKAGNIVLSPTGLEKFRACAFRFLLEETTGLAERVADFSQNDRRWYGTFIHRVCERFFRGLLAADPSLSPGRRAELETGLRAAADEEVELRERSGTHPLPPLWRLTKEDLVPGFSAFLDRTFEAFGPCTVRSAEAPAERVWPGERVLLSGDIDLILANASGIVIVDYKTRHVPRFRDIAVPPLGTGSSLQLPCYLLLAAARDEPVAAASYYSFEKKDYTHAYHPTAPKSYFTAENLAVVTEAARETLFRTARAIRAGDFTEARADENRCRDCPLRAVCRRKYHLRLEE